MHGHYVHGAPVAEARETYREIRVAAQRLLPGASYQRRLYWRYTLIWNRPTASPHLAP